MVSPRSGRRPRRLLLYAWAFSDTGQFEIAPGSDRLQVTGGLTADHFEEVLLSGRTLLAPTGLFGPYAGNPDDGANLWHRFLRQTWSLAATERHAPAVDYNTWYSLGLAVDEASCMRELHAAADLGADVFHLDAGWYRAPATGIPIRNGSRMVSGRSWRRPIAAA